MIIDTFGAHEDDNTVYWHQKLIQLYDDGKISTETLLEEMGIDYEKEVQRMKVAQKQLEK